MPEVHVNYDNEQNWQRFFDLRRKVFKAIEKIVTDPEDDGYHKSYEGAMDVTFCFDNYFEAEDVTDVELVKIELHCYLLVNGRHAEWYGKTFAEALDKAEKDIDRIIDGYLEEE